MKIFIGIPTRGIVFTETINSIMANCQYLTKVRPEIEVEIPKLVTISPVSDARNALVEAFLESESTHLWTVDDDESVPVNVLAQLVNLNQAVVVVDCPSKRTGSSNIFYNKNGSVAASGFGCALIERRVFETIERPWYDLKPWRIAKKINSDWQFPILHHDKQNSWGGEDVNFSLKILDRGFTIQAHKDLVCSHLEYEPFNSESRAVQILTINRYDQITRAIR